MINSSDQVYDYDYDVLIVGGGLVGSSLALAIAPLGLRIALCEAVLPDDREQPDYDRRSLALSYGSACLLEQWGIWPALASHATPLLQVHVSEQGCLGQVHIKASSEGVPALGYVIEVPHLNRVLNNKLQADPRIATMMPVTVTQAQRYHEGYALSITDAGNTRRVTARLLVVADGANSRLRTALGIITQHHDYQRSALVANIGLSGDHQGRAYERFAKAGPLALLPLKGRWASLVWTKPPEEAQALLKMSENLFLQQLQREFGYRLGRFLQLGKRQAFPLFKQQAKEQIREGLVLLGSAAHQNHPVAGQGFNLSLRDLAALSEAIRQTQMKGEAVGGFPMLLEYESQVCVDQRWVMAYTHTLEAIFTKRDPVLSSLRSLGLLSFEFLPLIKHRFALKNMGFQSFLIAE